METKVISSGFKYTNLPERYVRPESDRPNLSQVSDCGNVPLIDLSCGDRSLIVRQIGDACRDLGFFQVLNQGVSKDELEKMVEVAKEFFRLPVEERLKLYSDDPSKSMRLSTSFNAKKETVHNWRDYLRLHCYPLEENDTEWPSNPLSFKKQDHDLHIFKYLASRDIVGSIQPSGPWRIDMPPDEIHDQRGKNAMLWANNYKSASGANATDDDRASPVMPDVGRRENNIETEFNNNILGITAQAAITLMSSSSDSPFLHLCAAATGVGFLGSFLANYALKRPKIARILSKIGAIGVASAVIIALGMHFPKDTKWHLDVVATAIASFIAAVVVATS